MERIITHKISLNSQSKSIQRVGNITVFVNKWFFVVVTILSFYSEAIKVKIKYKYKRETFHSRVTKR